MKKDIFITIILLYFLTLLQSSFFSHFPYNQFFNLVLLIITLINLLEPQKGKLGIISAFWGGFFLDIFSERFFGYFFLIALGISVFIKFVLKKYFQPTVRLTQ